MEIYNKLQELRAHEKELKGRINDAMVCGRDSDSGDREYFRSLYRTLNHDLAMTQLIISELVKKLEVVK